MSRAAPAPRAEPWERRLYLPAYAVADAARYAGSSPLGVTSWQRRRAHPIAAVSRRAGGERLSYLELVEVAVAAAFGRAGVHVTRTATAHAYLSQILRDEYPFARVQAWTEGPRILMDLREIDGTAELDKLVLTDAREQIAWNPIVSECFARFDYERDLALRWHVEGRQSPVIIDPRVSFGAPAVAGVPTWTVAARLRAGETSREIADDFDLSEEQVTAALRFEAIDRPA